MPPASVMRATDVYGPRCGLDVVHLWGRRRRRRQDDNGNGGHREAKEKVESDIGTIVMVRSRRRRSDQPRTKHQRNRGEHMQVRPAGNYPSSSWLTCSI